MPRGLKGAVQLGIGVGAASLVLAGCGSSSTTSSGSAPSTASSSSKSSPIVIGAALGLSGSFEPYDKGALQAAELWADNANKHGGIGGRQVKFVTADMQSNPSQGPVAAEQVMSEGADIVLVSCEFNMGSPAAITATSKGTVAISVCAGSPDFGPQGIGPLAFTIGTPAETEGTAAAEFAYNNRHWRTVYTLTDTLVDYNVNYEAAFVKRFTALGGKVVGSDTFKNTDTSIATQVAHIKSVGSAASFILLPTLLPGGASAVRQIRSAGVNTPILAPNGMEGTFWTKASPGLKNFYYSNYASTNGKDPNPAVNAVTKEYTAKYGSAPASSFTYMGYALMQVLDKALTGVTDMSGTSIEAALEKVKSLPTVVGPTTFTKQYHISTDRSLEFHDIANNTSTYVTTIQPTDVPAFK